MLSQGDLVQLQKCSREGEYGIITLACKPNVLALDKPHLRLYWVMTDDGDVDCYTGRQLYKKGEV